MSAIAVITLSNAGARLAVRLVRAMGPRIGISKLVAAPVRAWTRLARPPSEIPPAATGSRPRLHEIVAEGLIQYDVFLHKDVARRFRGQRFPAVRTLTKRLFGRYCGLVYIMPCGVVVRAIAGLVEHKTTDPAVVVLDVGGRYAVSLLSGHEGGANALALRVANALAAEPVISTTSEAARDVIVGVGCRRGACAADIVAAVRQGLRRAGVRPNRVRWLASADIKQGEAGLVAAAAELGFGLRFISSGEIRSTVKAFRHSSFVNGKVNLPAVAEPAALLAGRRTQLILPKTIIRGVTVAVARENCL